MLVIFIEGKGVSEMFYDTTGGARNRELLRKGFMTKHEKREIKRNDLFYGKEIELGGENIEVYLVELRCLT